MKQTLTVWRTPQGYMVDFTDTREAETIRSYFDSTLIPSAYTAQADPQTVRAHIAKLNPEYHVVVR